MVSDPPETAASAPTPSQGDYEIEFQVPDDLFSLGVDLDDDAAAAAHAEFLDARLTGGAPPGTREQALAQLEAARRDLIEQRVRYLALASAEVDEHWAVCLFGISVAGFSPPAQFRPSPTLARVLQHQYSEGQAVVEEFATGHGLAVGVQRCDVLAVPGAEPPQHLDTGVAEAMVLFPDLEVVGVVNGYCLDLDDLDRTTAIVGAIAHTLNITAPSSASLSAR